MIRRGAVCLALAAGLAVGGGETGQAQQPGAAGKAPGYTVVGVTNGGTIRGTVAFTGTVPPPQAVKVTDDAAVCGQSQQIQTVEVTGGGLANAVISLRDITKGAALKMPAAPPALDQKACRFTPHVLLVAAGAPVHILNSDPVTHNIHTASFDNRPVNRAQPKDVRQIEVTFRAPEKVKVKCDIHGWMNGWVVVANNPYYALTDSKGAFVLENVPPGQYTLEAWHETLGARTQAVAVTAGQTASVKVSMAKAAGR